MGQDNSPILSEKDSLKVNLSMNEMLGATFGIVGFTALFISAEQDIMEITQNKNRTEMPGAPSAAPDIAALASMFILLANFVLTQIAAERLKEREKDIEAGNSTASIIPNINITNGFAISLLGSAVKAIGALQRVSENDVKVAID